MRSKVVSVLGVSALLLCGCTQAAPLPERVGVEDAAFPTHPAEERELAGLRGFGSSTGEFGPAGPATVAVYLECQSEGELMVNVADTGKVTIPCGTPADPTRTVFELDSPVDELSIDVESEDGPVWALTMTEAAS